MGSKSRQPAARVGDLDSGHSPYPPTPVISGSPDVLINGRPAARLGDSLAPHHSGTRVIVEGSRSVQINGRPAARRTDAINCGGRIAVGAISVVIGDQPEKVRNARAAGEFEAFMEACFKPENFGIAGRDAARLAAAIAVKFRGPEGAVASWHEYFLSTGPEPGEVLEPAEAAGLQRAFAEKAADLKRGENAAKAERWRQRQQQIAAARDRVSRLPPGAERERLAAATERFAQNNIVVEKARLSEDVYNPDDGPPPGWINISDDPEALALLGLEPEHLTEPGSTFRAQVYMPAPAVFGADMTPSVSFKGTEPGNPEDWRNNFAQAMDKDSLYYRKAVAIGRAVEKVSVDVDFVGHSAGGGQGSASARASGRPAYTFNAAGLHPNTVSRYGGVPKKPDPDNILAVRVEGDILTTVQESKGIKALLAGGASAVGSAVAGPPGAFVGGVAGLRKAAAIPVAAGVPHSVPGRGISPIGRHGMGQVIDGIEQQKEEDQGLLMASVTG